MFKTLSLKQRLIFLVLTAIAVAWITEALLTYHNTRKEVDTLLDAHLAQVAYLLTAQIEHELGELDEYEDLSHELVPQIGGKSMDVAFQVWERGQKLRLHSSNMPETPLTRSDQGFSDAVVDGQKWRVFSVWDSAHEYLVHVAEIAEVRERMSGAVARNLLLSLSLSLPLLSFLLWGAITRGLRPLVKLTREVATREPDNLAPVNVANAPDELVPLIEHLNRLFDRIDMSLQKERRFTAYAAHELRTPVAAIKAQAQVAQAASSEEELAHSVDNVIEGCDRASHMIDQLLTLSRIDALETGLTERCRLGKIASETIAAMAPTALTKGIHLELLEGSEIEVQGNRELLRILLRNLIENAVRHTPPGTVVQVSSAASDGANHLTVCDNGPGIPAHERGKVMERFYRPISTQASGSGLGLSIVKRVAEIHGATLRITAPDSGSGLCVEVMFPS